MSELNAQVRAAVERQFASVWVEGEVVNFTAASSGHWYFNLTDGKSQFRCVCWKGANYKIKFRPQNGITVRVRGKITLYQVKGELQLQVESLDQRRQHPPEAPAAALAPPGGLAHQLRALGVKDVGMLLPGPADFDCREIRPGLAHAVFALPAVAFVHPEPPRLGVQLEEKDEAVRVAQVVPGSLAERTGIKSGDHFLEVAGVAMKKVSPVIAAIRSQPAGTWLPLKVGRGEETLEIVVKFPAKP